jgi:hypothetical protein
MTPKNVISALAILLVLGQGMFHGNSAYANSAQENGETFATASRRVQMLYQSEQFTALEDAINELVHTNDKFISGKPKASAAYWAFRQQFPAPGVATNELEKIKRWREQIPQSSYAIFAESRYWYAMAWNGRGGNFAGRVQDESWKLFHANLQRAESLLLQSPASLKDTPLWHNLLLAISQDSTEVKSNPEQVLAAAALKWPQYYDFYEVRLTRLVPKWGGDWQTVDAFISHWAKKQSKLEGKSLYARLYISMQSSNAVPASEIKPHWGKLKGSLRDLVKRYPDPKFKNLFASYACLLGDAKQFRETMTASSATELNPMDWLPDAPYASCVDLK